MQQKFRSSITGEVKFAIGFLLFYWVFSTLVSVDTNGLKGSINLSLLVLVFGLAFVYGLVKHTYLTIEGNQIKYVSFFFERKAVSINDVNKITVSRVAGFMKFLCIVYSHNDKEKLLQISPISFSKKTLSQFVSELKKNNPQIDIDKSVNSLIS